MNQKLWIAILFVLESCQQVYSSGTRRILDGKDVTTDKGYMVYLLKASDSDRLYDEWICGGAIVTESFIVTSAACVEDVQFMYAVTGTKTYSKAAPEKEPCALKTKKRIIMICTPTKYDFSFNEVEKWAFIDIAAVKVDTPFNFKAAKVAPCTWQPKPIDINYEMKYQMPNTDAMVLGWGHEKKWRQLGDTTNQNTPTLHYSSILIMDKTECKQQYEKVPELYPIIDKYMICAMMDGNINEKGDMLKRSQPVADGCPSGAIRIGDTCQPPLPPMEPNLGKPPIEKGLSKPPITFGLGPEQNPWIYENSSGSKQIAEKSDFNPYAIILDNAKQEKQAPIKQLPDDDITFDDIANFRRVNNEPRFNYTRKAGICQNDHGGPLVTWVGSKEYLIGVASVFRLDNEFDCIGPFLFTSTQCNGAFLDCVLNQNMGETTNTTTTTKAGGRTPPTNYKRFQLRSGPDSRRSEDVCSMPPAERGFDIKTRRVSWINHPDGPAANELKYDLYERPQIPLQEIRPPV